MPRGHGRGQASRARVTGVDGRGRYGKESIGIASWKRERRTDKESKEGCKLEELIRRCQGLALAATKPSGNAAE